MTSNHVFSSSGCSHTERFYSTRGILEPLKQTLRNTADPDLVHLELPFGLDGQKQTLKTPMFPFRLGFKRLFSFFKNENVLLWI